MAHDTRLALPLVRAVIFDWAGTTQDHGSVAPVAALIELFARRGVEVSPANARTGMGRHKRDHLAALLAQPEVARDWQSIMGRRPSPADIDELFAAFLPIQAETIRRFAPLIPGTLETVAALRRRDIAIGSTTGYTRELLDVAAAEAAAEGFTPDVTVCADEVPAARPEPWMVLRAMERLRAFPPAAVVKVGDTPVDMAEGRNAGTWAIGVARTGSLVGRTLDELATMDPDELARGVAGAGTRLLEAGAHYVVDSVADVLPVVDLIEYRVAAGDRP